MLNKKRLDTHIQSAPGCTMFFQSSQQHATFGFDLVCKWRLSTFYYEDASVCD